MKIKYEETEYKIPTKVIKGTTWTTKINEEAYLAMLSSRLYTIPFATKVFWFGTGIILGFGIAVLGYLKYVVLI